MNEPTNPNRPDTSWQRNILIPVSLLANCILLGLSWQNDVLVFLVFFAFIPVFLLLERPSFTFNDRLQLHIFSFTAVFVAIYFIIQWIRNVDSGSHLATVLLRAITVYIPYLVAFFIRFRLKRTAARSALGFTLAWMITEVLHDLNILGLPYGNLGHLLGARPDLVQWYSATGVLGGTAWILLVNFSIYFVLRNLINPKREVRARLTPLLILACAVLLPAFISLALRNKQQQCKVTDISVIALHTSMDVFEYKYDVQPSDLVEMYIEQTRPAVDTSMKTIVFWPENAITGEIFYRKPDSSMAVKMIREELIRQPNTIIVTGAIVDKIVDPPGRNEYAPGILFDSTSGNHFRHYNTALFLNQNEPASIKIKKRLVPLSEEIPPRRIFAPLVSLVPNLEGLSFSRDAKDTVLFSFFDDRARTTPIICYGSTFSPFVAEEIKASKSDFMAIILNEGWMKDRKAYTHFNWFAVCRAIENRRFVVKSSNEGISAMINCDGKILKKQEGPNPGVLNSTLRINNSLTFYTKHHMSILYGILVLCIAGIVWIIMKKGRSISGTASELLKY